MWEKGNFTWFILTGPHGMRGTVAQVSWRDAGARWHRALCARVRPWALIQREYGAFERF